MPREREGLLQMPVMLFDLMRRAVPHTAVSRSGDSLEIAVQRFVLLSNYWPHSITFFSSNDSRFLDWIEIRCVPQFGAVLLQLLRDFPACSASVFTQPFENDCLSLFCLIS